MRTAIGQDSHRFEEQGSDKPLMLGGVYIPDCPGLAGNSDADVILHAITNAISGISGQNILGTISDRLCLDQGITDSAVYLKYALDTLREYRLRHVSISVECRRPKLSPHIDSIKKHLGILLNLESSSIGLTATTGEGLTAFGRGEGVQALVIATAQRVSAE
ncbi:MAG: 2-C-methyl-D-erythritol 2,4-cyclodiphosphate synthase [Fibrobacterota bacterium]